MLTCYHAYENIHLEHFYRLLPKPIGDIEIDMLRKRLVETEAAMERIVSQMGSVSDQLTPSVLAQVLRARGVCQVCNIAFCSL